MEPFGPDDLKFPFSRSNKPLSKTTKSSHFQGQMTLRAGNPPILHILVCYSLTSFFVIVNFDVIFAKNFIDAMIIGDSDFRHHFCQNFLWTSLNILSMELVGLDG
ncbi:hypothetical protein H5410_053003 [Solanum commersonii]|uniref:Uncharacterized protein n=1 Tax=Solanum commersonii TaxID=4109 RepID=A0A9J5X5U2_SOLCO|nr:hypothetical protein H5410_053003 [Solanum commersonii]